MLVRSEVMVIPPEIRFASGQKLESPDRQSTNEYNPDDLDLDPPRRAAVASASATTSGRSTNVPSIRVSAMSEIKELAGQEGGEDRARAWLSKVKSAFVRDQAPDEEKCLVFGDIPTGSARNWYRQLGCTIRSSWKDLLRSFQIQYCGRGVSVASQYYHACKRSEESPLEYLYRLNVAGLRARLQIKDRPSETRREHVEHFIEEGKLLMTAILQITLPCYGSQMLSPWKKHFDLGNERRHYSPRQKDNSATAPSYSTRAVRAVKAISDMSLKRTLVDHMTKQDYVVSTSQHPETMKGSKIKIKGTKIAVNRRPETIVPDKIDMI
ncbi:LOW QUALITY PROTEIN: Hypothetical protein PHPALM_36389 [Phytophthora palmivora]|uniref:Retrotransposon gag domain-containing protein n=1 Tax=Phytophthora palmivora TaxID=4796 RepID=A0A2P4X031_9STRA|nr:LOW QUALITY PROTEIN: Hypothetical protein PHPALM_36389 [Phytophthora palmivora]